MTSISRNLTVWGRELEIEVLYETLSGEGVIPAQDEALEAILAKWEVVDQSLDAVKSFCVETYPLELDAIAGGRTIDNIFRFVVPERLLLLRREEARSVELLCRSRLDPEHGLAIYFENEQLAGVGTESTVF